VDEAQVGEIGQGLQLAHTHEHLNNPPAYLIADPFGIYFEALCRNRAAWSLTPA
jgi:hypothetical protein